MSVKQHTCYTVACDKCGKGCNVGNSHFDEIHWESGNEAISRAMDGDWIAIGDSLYCDECAERVPGGVCLTCKSQRDDHGATYGWACAEYRDPAEAMA